MKLKDYLDRKKLTQAQFGVQIGASQATVHRYMTGRWPSREMAIAIERATKGRVSANDFLVVFPPEPRIAEGNAGLENADAAVAP